MPTQPSISQPSSPTRAVGGKKPSNPPLTHAVGSEKPVDSPPPPGDGGAKPKHPGVNPAAPNKGRTSTPRGANPQAKATLQDKAAVDEAWRKDWYSQHPRTERCRPTEDEFRRAMSRFNDDSLTGDDYRFAALASLPTPVEPGSAFSMMILCRSGAATFPLQVMLDSIGAELQPLAWLAAKPALRDFKKVHNVGISFTCTDRATVDKIGGIKLTVCGKQFPILAYSEYSALYWVDIVLSNEATAENVYEYFVHQNERPVLITSTYDKYSVKSRHVTVYFKSNEPPACLMYGKDDPVREIFPLGNDSFACYVNHRISRYNAGPPPSIKAKQARDKAKKNTKQPPAPQAPPSTPTRRSSPVPSILVPEPTKDDQAMDDAQSLDEEIHLPIDPRPHKADHVMDDSTPDEEDTSESEEDDVCSMGPPTLIISPSIAGDREEVRHPGAPTKDAPMWLRIQYSRKVMGVKAANVSPRTSKSIFATTTNNPTAVEYEFSTLNRFAILADDESDAGNIPPPLKVAINGSQNTRAKFNRQVLTSTASLRQYDTLASDYAVESMPMAEFLSFLESYIATYQSSEDPEEAMAMLQANPGHLLPLIDGDHPTNYDILETKLQTHVLQRCIQPRFTLEEVQAARDARADSIFTSRPIWQFLVPDTSMPGLLHQLLDDQSRPLAWAAARLCQYLQINQPELYFNQAKIYGLLLSLKPFLPAATVPANPHFLWTDATICALAKSALGDYLLQSNIPHALSDAIHLLAAAHPLTSHHIGCFLA
ncbi:hypothetical protein H257_18938 [Aphanomyces astaci]|uniref:Uncharacterized protein n=1 Tax=Aphanomyces astaci TaxID=112090 RepID=W4FB45_APHAT|nr:hypothetical protein H257_18938 [Aphanomyces astaci]ETV64129.1 hypothetical protein H257_18938 [Aphanomyces astaci]|eukprot:XP_009846387.1 hypothetical protein H257_18938 [Aphanomyces astaci]